MRSILYVLSAVMVIGLGYWAYKENYTTQANLREVRGLHAQIGAAHAWLNVLQAEWAYLNRPDRLRDLAELNFERLRLLPLMPDAFGRIEAIAYPQTQIFDLSNSIEVSSDNAPQSEDRP